jgi:transcriptional antiterminator RfaH
VREWHLSKTMNTQATLLSQSTHIVTTKHWYVIYTKPKHEKKVANKLQSRGIECYCPLKIQSHQWSDRKKKVESPLFNSFLFVRVLEKERNVVFSVSGVVRYLFWCGKAAIVKDYEIETIKHWLNDFDHDQIELRELKVGQNVKIASGSFMNRNASVVKQRGQHLELQFEGLGLVLRTKLNNVRLD